jgi:hypothetical protein
MADLPRIFQYELDVNDPASKTMDTYHRGVYKCMPATSGRINCSDMTVLTFTTYKSGYNTDPPLDRLRLSGGPSCIGGKTNGEPNKVYEINVAREKLDFTQDNAGTDLTYIKNPLDPNVIPSFMTVSFRDNSFYTMGHQFTLQQSGGAPPRGAWRSTGRKIVVDGKPRAAFRNPAHPGEVRIRKMRKNARGDSTAVYVIVPQTTSARLRKKSV